MNYPRWLIVGLYAFGVGAAVLVIVIAFFFGVATPAWLLGPTTAVPFMLATWMWIAGEKRDNHR